MAKKSDSAGSCKDAESVWGFKINRANMPADMRMKRHMSNRKTISPRMVNPLNRCGVLAMRRASPPVLMVRVYQAQVKC